MAGINLNGKDFKGGAGGAKLEEAGTYPCTLIGASAYQNNKYQSDELTNQITLIWDTGYIGENDDGEEVPVYIYDAWINLSLNEKAKLISRFRALLGGTLDAETAQVNIKGITSLDALQHWKEGRTTVEGITVNDTDLFGLEALVTVEINDAGYPKVTQVAPPVKSAPGGKKMKPRATAEVPAGAPV